MKMILKFATSLVAVAAFSAVIFAGTRADSVKPAQSAAFVAAVDASPSRDEPSPANGPLNSKETPQEQQVDLQYN